MKQVLFTFVAGFVLVPPAPLRAAEPNGPERKPNIVFILADDSGFADFGCYGHPYARTPNIDRLAAEGTCFRQFYATGVTCCPARTGLMTGRWPASYSTYPANGGFGKRVAVTELLKRAGYATGHFGKWHIGPDEKAGTYGIDVVGTAEPGAKKKNERGRDAPIFDAAIRFVEKNKDRPFYVNVWGHVSHHRVDPPKGYVEKFKDVVVDEAKFSESMREKFAACRALFQSRLSLSILGWASLRSPQPCMFHPIPVAINGFGKAVRRNDCIP